jgi:hypothetical protein
MVSAVVTSGFLLVFDDEFLIMQELKSSPVELVCPHLFVALPHAYSYFSVQTSQPSSYYSKLDQRKVDSQSNPTERKAQRGVVIASMISDEPS